MSGAHQEFDDLQDGMGWMGYGLAMALELRASIMNMIFPKTLLLAM